MGRRLPLRSCTIPSWSKSITCGPSIAAAATTKLKIGSGVCLLIERDTITTAKEVASLDRLSGGHFLFGIGGGWNQEEMENHGTRFETRWKRLRESVEAMKQIWANEKAEYHGELVGVVNLTNRAQRGVFGAEDVERVRLLALVI